MQKLVTFTFLILRVAQTFSETTNSTFHYLVCQQCNSSCSVEQSIPEGPTRVGIACPKGDPRPPGEVNMTAIEELIDRKIREALQLDITTPVPETTIVRKPVLPENCRNISLESAKCRNAKGGVFDINIPGYGLKEVFCDTTTDGGGWVVFQRRMDGSVDFYKVWSDYVNGFGYRIGEFWLGLEAIHQLTKAGQHEFRVDMVRTDEARYYLKCSSFKIEAVSDNYSLRVSGCSGTAAWTSFVVHNKAQFSTRDRDNDQYSGDCAAKYHGAWWYRACLHTNLNGQYGASDGKGIYWGGVGNMRFTEMKVRRKL